MEAPKEGEYWRHSETGDLYKCQEMDGTLKLVRDLPNASIWVPMTRAHEFKREHHAKRMMPGQMARIAFECDAALCRTHMDMPRPKEWLSLNEKDKAEWIDGRIKITDPIRQELYVAVNKVLLKYNDE